MHTRARRRAGSAVIRRRPRRTAFTRCRGRGMRRAASTCVRVAGRRPSSRRLSQGAVGGRVRSSPARGPGGVVLAGDCIDSASLDRTRDPSRLVPPPERAPDPVALPRLHTSARGAPQILNRQTRCRASSVRRITGHTGVGTRRATFISRPAEPAAVPASAPARITPRQDRRHGESSVLRASGRRTRARSRSAVGRLGPVVWSPRDASASGQGPLGSHARSHPSASGPPPRALSAPAQTGGGDGDPPGLGVRCPGHPPPHREST